MNAVIAKMRFWQVRARQVSVALICMLGVVFGMLLFSSDVHADDNYNYNLNNAYYEDNFRMSFEAEVGAGFSLFWVPQALNNDFYYLGYSASLPISIGLRLTPSFTFSLENDFLALSSKGVAGVVGLGFKFYLLEINNFELWTKVGLNFLYLSNNTDYGSWSGFVPFPMLKAAIGGTYMFHPNIGAGLGINVHIMWLMYDFTFNGNIQLRF
ncbi:MAG: hypothetical protein FWC40_04895 [Proteobacteria bacterium]|nr:hypothetical protein [Pseudomonadota bacterium]